jgi:hypothetical protein
MIPPPPIPASGTSPPAVDVPALQRRVRELEGIVRDVEYDGCDMSTDLRSRIRAALAPAAPAAAAPALPSAGRLVRVRRQDTPGAWFASGHALLTSIPGMMTIGAYNFTADDFVGPDAQFLWEAQPPAPASEPAMVLPSGIVATIRARAALTQSDKQSYDDDVLLTTALASDAYAAGVAAERAAHEETKASLQELATAQINAKARAQDAVVAIATELRAAREALVLIRDGFDCRETAEHQPHSRHCYVCIAAVALAPPGSRCGCTHEAGDSPCPIHDARTEDAMERACAALAATQGTPAVAPRAPRRPQVGDEVEVSLGGLKRVNLLFPVAAALEAEGFTVDNDERRFMFTDEGTRWRWPTGATQGKETP